MAARSKTPKLDAAVAWLAQAKKGERMEVWRGHLDRACATPESNMSNAQRRAHQAASRKARKLGKPRPDPPDPYAKVRDEARLMIEWLERNELRGLIEIKITVMDAKQHDRIYEVECAVQRNGLAAVRARR